MHAPAIVFAPGMMCDARLFAHQIAALKGDHDCIVADFSRDQSIEAMAARLLAQAPARFYLAGLSMGGIVALEVMREAPSRVVGLALMDTTPLADALERRAMREAQMQRANAGDLARLVIEDLNPNYLSARTKRDQALVAEIFAMAQDLGADVFIRQSRALINRRDNIDVLCAIACPVDVICGEEDALCPLALHRAMADEIAGARLTVIPSCGHLASMEAPEIVTSVLRAGMARAETEQERRHVDAHQR